MYPTKLSKAVLAGALLFGALSMGAVHATAQEAPATEEPAQEVEFRYAGEELYYSIRLNGVEAIRAAARVGDVRYKEGHPYVAVSGTAQSAGIFHNIYPVNNRADTFFNPVSLRPLRSEKFFDESGKVRSYHVDFTHSTYRAKVLKTRDEQPRRRFTKPIPGTTHDMATWFFELRKHPDLKVGDEMAYFIYDGWKLYRLRARVVKKEDVYSPIGWFKSYRIDFTREALNTKRTKGAGPILSVSKPEEPSGSLWVSRDENLIPVKVSVNTQWGVGEALLIKYKLPSMYRKED